MDFKSIQLSFSVFLRARKRMRVEGKILQLLERIPAEAIYYLKWKSLIWSWERFDSQALVAIEKPYCDHEKMFALQESDTKVLTLQ